MKNDSFLFYSSYYSAIKELPDNERLKMYDAICIYALEHEDIATDGVAKAMMMLIKPLLDANYKRKMNGAKGGRPKTAQSGEEPEDKADNQGKENQTKTKVKPNENQSVTKLKGNDNVNANVNANANVKDNKITRHRYGLYNNVLLSDEDFEKLKKEYPADWQDWIEKCSSYCRSSGKHYSDYLATIRNWARKEQKERMNKYSSEDRLPVYEVKNNAYLSSEEEQELLRLMKGNHETANT